MNQKHSQSKTRLNIKIATEDQHQYLNTLLLFDEVLISIHIKIFLGNHTDTDTDTDTGW